MMAKLHVTFGNEDAGKRIDVFPVTELVLSAVVLIIFPNLVLAYDFTPTESEFRTWPSYCKVVYLRTPIGKSTTFQNLINNNDVVEARRVLGVEKPFGVGGVHHYCTGTIFLARARLEMDPRIRDSLLDRAVRETLFTLRRSKSDETVFVLAATQMANVLVEQGKDIEAMELLDSSIQQYPANSALRIAEGSIYFRSGDFERARDSFLQADNHSHGSSAEIHYALGLISIKLGDMDSAVRRARIAYGEGYPLPGLRRQLEQLGYWDDVLQSE